MILSCYIKRTVDNVQQVFDDVSEILRLYIAVLSACSSASIDNCKDSDDWTDKL